MHCDPEVLEVQSSDCWILVILNHTEVSENESFQGQPNSQEANVVTEKPTNE